MWKSGNTAKIKEAVATYGVRIDTVLINAMQVNEGGVVVKVTGWEFNGAWFDYQISVEQPPTRGDR